MTDDRPGKTFAERDPVELKQAIEMSFYELLSPQELARMRRLYQTDGRAAVARTIHEELRGDLPDRPLVIETLTDGVEAAVNPEGSD